MSTARAADAAGVCEQRSVGLGDVEVVGLDRDRVEHGGDESGTALAPLLVSQLDADPQLCHGDRGDRDVVLVADESIDRVRTLALGGDQDRGVEDQACQRSIPGPTP